MIGALLPAGAAAPQDRSEGEHGKKEECAYHFQPDLSTHGTERPEKTGDAASHIAGGLSGSLRSCANIGGLALRGRGRFGRVCDALTGDASGDTQSNAQYAANRFRSHFDTIQTTIRRVFAAPGMMVTAADIRRPWSIQKWMAVAGSPLAN